MMGPGLQFEAPWIIMLGWLVPVLVWIWISVRRRAEHRLQAFISGPMQARLRFPVPKQRLIWQITLTATGLLLLIIAGAQPYWGDAIPMVSRTGHDIVIALDVSRSMLAQDAHPNRMERARSALSDFLDLPSPDRIGLVAFRQNGTILCPLTYDRHFVAQSLQSAGPDSAIPGETDIGAGIHAACRLFPSHDGARRVILLVTDGEDLAAHLPAALAAAQSNRVTIVTVGVGSVNGSPVPGYTTAQAILHHDDQPVTTRLDADTLRLVADVTGGAYIPLQGTRSGTVNFGRLCERTLRSLAARKTSQQSRRQHIPRYRIFLLPAFWCLLIPVLLGLPRLRRTRARTSKRPANALVILIAAGLLTAAQSYAADPLHAAIRAAHHSYRRGDFTNAAQQFSAVVPQALPARQTELTFNAAAAWFAAGEYSQATLLLRKLAALEPCVPPHIAAARGEILYHQAQSIEGDGHAAWQQRADLYQHAAEAFLQAARAPNSHPSTSSNLALALRAAQTASQTLATRRQTAATPPEVQKDLTKTQPAAQNKHAPENDGTPESDVKSSPGSPTLNAIEHMTEEQIEAFLEHALEREREHAAQQRRRNQRAPFHPGVRDW